MSLEAQRVNKNVKKQRKQQRGGGEGEERGRGGEGRGVCSIIVSHVVLLRMYFIVNFFLFRFCSVESKASDENDVKKKETRSERHKRVSKKIK